MQIEQEAYNALSSRAASVLGKDRILQLQPEQQNLLDEMLDDLLEQHEGNPKSPSNAEIKGVYRMVVQHLLPTNLLEHFRKPSE